MKALIIDDERLARQELQHLLKTIEVDIDIEIVGEAKNGKEGIQQIKKLQPDLIFLDIHMPDMDGFKMLQKLDEIPKVIFTTAYDEYAIEAFRVNALDYLLKPIEPKLLEEALQRIGANEDNDFFSNLEYDREHRLLNKEDYIFIKDGEKCYFPRLKDIRYFESQGNYVRIYFDDEKPMVLKSLNSIEEKISAEDFFRANRKYLINLHFIDKLENWFNGGLKILLKDGTDIEVSRRQARKFKEIMSF